MPKGHKQKENKKKDNPSRDKKQDHKTFPIKKKIKKIKRIRRKIILPMTRSKIIKPSLIPRLTQRLTCRHLSKKTY
jgi:hypothetical protein